MPTLTDQLPTINQPNSTEDPKVRTALSDIIDLLNGKLDKDNLAGTAGFVLRAAGGNLKIAVGNGSFAGTGNSLAVSTIAHNLGAPGLGFITCTPSLQSGGVWTGTFGQYQAATNTNAYIAFVIGNGPAFNSGSTYFFNWFAISAG